MWVLEAVEPPSSSLEDQHSNKPATTMPIQEEKAKPLPSNFSICTGGVKTFTDLIMATLLVFLLQLGLALRLWVSLSTVGIVVQTTVL
jgi:hypothetical protein